MNKSEKCSVTQKGRKVIHKDNIEKRVYPDELQQFLDNGWELGVCELHKTNNSKSKIGKTPWNKGLTKETNDSINSTAQKLSIINKGKTAWNKGIYGERYSYYGKPRSEQVKQKISSSKIGHAVSEETKTKISATQKGRHKTEQQLEIYLQKCYETRSKNNTFNTSTLEESYYTNLCNVFGKDNVKRQYRDKRRYPFRCDFYIPSEDLFIELNLHWTHGGKPYDPNDEGCRQQLQLWKEKAKQSKFYQNAIETWTVRDTKKLQYAKENNLNYKVIYK